MKYNNSSFISSRSNSTAKSVRKQRKIIAKIGKQIKSFLWLSSKVPKK